MAVLLMILLFAVFIGIDFVRTRYVGVKGARLSQRVYGTQFTTPGYEFLGSLAQDGGKPIEKK
jgi:hypothetical protein